MWIEAGPLVLVSWQQRDLPVDKTAEGKGVGNCWSKTAVGTGDHLKRRDRTSLGLDRVKFSIHLSITATLSPSPARPHAAIHSKFHKNFVAPIQNKLPSQSGIKLYAISAPTILNCEFFRGRKQLRCRNTYRIWCIICESYRVRVHKGTQLGPMNYYAS